MLCERFRRPTQRVRHAPADERHAGDRRVGALFRRPQLSWVSIDGPLLHDAYRLNRGGRGTHAMVVRGWEAPRARGRRRTSSNFRQRRERGPRGWVYRYFRRRPGARYLQFIPIVEGKNLAQRWRPGTSALLYRQDGDCVTSRSTSPASYGRFLCE